MAKKKEGNEKIKNIKSANDILKKLNGKNISKLSKSELDDLIIVIGVFCNICNSSGDIV